MSQHHYRFEDLRLLDSGLLSDATVTYGDRTWQVHKSIICRCEWFREAFISDFEGAQTNTVDISVERFSREVVDCAIRFIYSGAVDNIEKLGTNGSVADACIRLWVIADFLALKELQDDAVAILQEHCDEKAKLLCLFECGWRMFSSLDSGGYEALLAQMFCGVKTAYTHHPHSVPCQQVLVSFFHNTRAFAFGTKGFYTAMSNAPLQFSHDLFMATIGGGAGMVSAEKSEYRHPQQGGNCTGCGIPATTNHLQWEVCKNSG